MKALALVKKQSEEHFVAGDIYVDWADDLGTGETISTCVVTVYDANGNDVTSTLASGDETISGTYTSVALKGGTDGQVYTVEHVIQTSAGSTKAESFDLEIDDTP